MKRLFSLVILVILVAGLVLFGLSDSVISIGNTDTPNKEVTGTVSKASNSSASATVTVTMYAVADE
ncbi:MAG: hypothetical protein WBH01_05680 [Dehalococcoidia bacterium]